MRRRSLKDSVHALRQDAKSKGFQARLLRQGPLFFFDAVKCEMGLQHLRQYQWGPPSAATGTVKRDPLHDEHSAY